MIRSNLSLIFANLTSLNMDYYSPDFTHSGSPLSGKESISEIPLVKSEAKLQKGLISLQ